MSYKMSARGVWVHKNSSGLTPASIESTLALMQEQRADRYVVEAFETAANAELPQIFKMQYDLGRFVLGYQPLDIYNLPLDKSRDKNLAAVGVFETGGIEAVDEDRTFSTVSVKYWLDTSNYLGVQDRYLFGMLEMAFNLVDNPSPTDSGPNFEQGIPVNPEAAVYVGPRGEKFLPSEITAANKVLDTELGVIQITTIAGKMKAVHDANWMSSLPQRESKVPLLYD